MTQNIALRTEFFRDLVSSFDLVEEVCGWILEEVRQEVETATVRHP